MTISTLWSNPRESDAVQHTPRAAAQDTGEELPESKPERGELVNIRIVQPAGAYRVQNEVGLSAGSDVTFRIDTHPAYVTIGAPTAGSQIAFSFGGSYDTNHRVTCAAGSIRRARCIGTLVTVRNTGSAACDVELIEHDDPAII